MDGKGMERWAVEEGMGIGGRDGKGREGKGREGAEGERALVSSYLRHC